jgi:hypothetical protein
LNYVKVSVFYQKKSTFDVRLQYQYPALPIKIYLPVTINPDFMKKHISFLFIFSIGLQFYSVAQVFVADLPPGYNKVVSAESEKGLDGSPWLTENWVPGTVTLINGRTIEGLNYRYNVYRNQLYFKYGDAEYMVGSRDSIDYLKMDGKKFVYDNSDPEKKDKIRLMEVVVDGKARMYVNYYPEIIPANYNIALGSGNKNETVAVREAYLIKVRSVLTVVDKKGKLIPVALADKNQEVSAFIKKEKISPKKRADIEMVVRYYNSLQN